ncbi:D-alanyl-D-alanine carboxypeptidase [Levilactobacillus bambusae]|uniref:D-alanyl-D-alanine carboxypeptidase n=2 Tax=Levilactobacillus bambusae TaxID=2024736 RepID=A0A2V1N1H8_9LACO|nr:D-alanyl-D-alanine carboxypeptidase [Levilactobacillus bambusae]
MSGNTNFTFSGRTHNLKNYPHTTWIVTKKAYIVKHNTNTTSLYYYVTNGHGDVSGWIWHGYLTPKPKPVAKAASYAAVYNKAKAQLGKPYAWGAAGANSFDCSGLTQYVYKQAINKQLPRTAQSQYNSYSHVSTNNLKKGDLVFFGSNAGNISHTGIYVGSNKMIDAQNRGVITENIHASWWNLVGASRPANLQ